jgi:urease accessory protein
MPRVRRADPPLAPGALLQLMWLASPALPVGGFSYSEALEAAVESGHVRCEADAARWLVDQLGLTLARSELGVAAKAFGAWRRVDAAHVRELNDWVLVSRETRELRAQTEQMGRSLVEWLKNRGAADERVALLAALPPSPTWPVAFALAAVQTGAPLREALLALAFGWAENLVQAPGSACSRRWSRRSRARSITRSTCPTAGARPSRRCSRSCRRSTRRSTRACSTPSATLRVLGAAAPGHR